MTTIKDDSNPILPPELVARPARLGALHLDLDAGLARALEAQPDRDAVALEQRPGEAGEQ